MSDSRDHEAMVREPESWWLDESAYAGRENLDEQHARRYDAKEDAQAAEESRMLQDQGVLGSTTSVVDLGAGTGQFALAAAGVCRSVVAVDVSPVMSARPAEKIDARGLSNVQTVRAGFLTYRHAGPPADLVYSRYALHHLPDSTFTWLLEPMIERAGFTITEAQYSASGVFAQYMCTRRDDARENTETRRRLSVLLCVRPWRLVGDG